MSWPLNLKSCREYLRFSLRDAAENTRLSYETVRRVESGESESQEAKLELLKRYRDLAVSQRQVLDDIVAFTENEARKLVAIGK